jgi:hypothetical protein
VRVLMQESLTASGGISNIPGNIVVTMSKITIYGEENEFDAAAVAVATNKIVTLFGKEKRAALSEEKW